MQATHLTGNDNALRGMRSVYEAREILKREFTSVWDISWNGLYLKRLFHGNAIPGPKIVACGVGLSRTKKWPRKWCEKT